MNEWQPIETAPKGGYIVVAVPWGSKWSFHQVHNEYDDWIDVSSDKIVSPTHWMPLPNPPTETQNDNT